MNTVLKGFRYSRYLILVESFKPNDRDLRELSNGAISTVHRKYVSREHTETAFAFYGLILAKFRFNVCEHGPQRPHAWH